MDMCEDVVQLENPENPIYGCDAFWNTFWNLNQFWNLVTPEWSNNWVNRKVLADLAMNEPEAFKAIVDKIK